MLHAKNRQEMIKIIVLILIANISTFCFGQDKTIFGTYEYKTRLHLYNPICPKSKLIINPDSTFMFIDCDWLRQDTVIGKCKIETNSVFLLNFGTIKSGIGTKLYYKRGNLFRTKFRRLLNIKYLNKT